jgi:lipopolysaccharide export system protein LptA
VNAPRFDCDFYPGTNDAKSCAAGVKSKAVRVPTVADDAHGTQTIVADKLTAAFDAKTKDVERLDAVGGAKFTELDRNAISSQFSFTTADRTVRLRGSEPTAWDSKARAKAKEIDWDTRNQKSYLRGGVSTTYYSQNQTGGSTPFSDTKKPVFITAANAEIDHRQETGLYTGNARGWQESNYVRAESFLISQRAEHLTQREMSRACCLMQSERRMDTKPIFLFMPRRKDVIQIAINDRSDMRPTSTSDRELTA